MRVVLHLEGVLPGGLGTRGTRNGDHGPTWTLTELPEDLGSRFREGQSWKHSRAVAQPGPRGGWHVSPRPRRGLSEGLGVTRKDPAEAGRIPAWRGCCQTTESTQAGLDRKALVKS